MNDAVIYEHYPICTASIRCRPSMGNRGNDSYSPLRPLAGEFDRLVLFWMLDIFFCVILPPANLLLISFVPPQHRIHLSTYMSILYVECQEKLHS